jgi:polyisoprenoid-binding protein YceI
MNLFLTTTLRPKTTFLSICAGLVLQCLAVSTMAQPTAAAQRLVSEQSTIGFVTKQMGVPVEGKFSKIDAQIAFDPKKPETSKIAFTISTDRAVIGDAETIRELKKATWFDVAKFPTATFIATTAKLAGPGKFEVTGNLTIKGTTKVVTTMVTVSQKAGISTVEGSVPVKRLDFKLGDGDWKDTSIVADEVIIKFKLAVNGIAAL